MKKYYILLAGVLLAATIQTQAQTKIGGSGAPDNSAMLEVTGGPGNNKGILPPRLTTAQRDGITLPATGLIIYNTTANQLQINTGTPAAPIWTSTAPPSMAWLLLGNTGINPATQFIGTTDNQPLVFRTRNLERMRLDTNGYVSVGTTTPHSLLDLGAGKGLTLSDAAGKKLAVFNDAGGNDFYGLGVSTNVLQFHAGSILNGNPGMVMVKGSNNIGIGTVSPAANLDVAGTTRISGSAGTATAIVGRNAAGDISNLALGAGLSIAGGTLNTTAAAGWALAGNAGTNPATQFVGTTDAQPLVFRTGNAERARISQNGDLLLGTTSSLAKGNIVAGANQTGLLVQGDATAGASIPLIVQTTASSNNSGIALRLYSQQTGAVGNLDLGVLPGQAGSLQMYKQPGNIPGSIALNAIAGGNVGIGTVAPAQKLDVAGTARISGSAGTATSIVGRNVTGDISNITLGSNLSLSGGVLNATVPATTGWALAGNAGINPATQFVGTTDAQPLILRTNNTEHLRIASTGNVGIDDATPLAPLSFASAIGPKIRFYDDGTDNLTYGIGVSAASLNYHIEAGASAAHRFFAGGSNGDGTEVMRIQSDGNVGIGSGVSTYPLQVARPDFGAYGGLAVRDIDGANASTFTITPGYVGSTPAFGVSLDVTGDAPIAFVDNIQPAASGVFSSGTPDFRWLNIFGNNADFAGTARIAGSAGTPAAIMGRDASGNIGNITLGANLSLAGGVLSASGGGTAGWGLNGNAGTNPATDYVGTSDAQHLTFRTNAIERMRITPTGNIGIGTTNPLALLDLESGDLALTPEYSIRWGNGTNAERIFQSPSLGYPGQNLFLEAREYMVLTIDRNGTATNSNNVGFVFNTNSSWSDGTPTELMRLTDAGNLGLGTASPNYKMDVAGDINASGQVRSNGVALTSDARLKRNISKTKYGLSAIMALNPVEYEKKGSINDKVYNRHEIGFTAQEVARVLPSLVTEGKDADKTLAVSYTELIPVLTKAIQEQQAQIEALKTENQKSQAQIDALKTENQKLKVSNNVTAELMERVKKMEQLLAIKANESSSTVAVK